MKDTSKIRFVSDVDVDSATVTVRRPFKLSKESNRKYVRLEITSPVSLKRVKDIFGKFWPEGEPYTIDGYILNISTGGVLVEIDEPLNDGDLVLLQFSLQNAETVDNVLGLVKRCDGADEDCYLVGVEFITRERLQDLLSYAEAQMMDQDCSYFQDRVKQVLQHYIVKDQKVSR